MVAIEAIVERATRFSLRSGTSSIVASSMAARISSSVSLRSEPPICASDW